MTDTAELIARLREKARFLTARKNVLLPAMLDDAADALAALQAEVARLTERVAYQEALKDGARRRAESAEAERDTIAAKLAEAVDEREGWKLIAAELRGELDEFREWVARFNIQLPARARVARIDGENG